MTSKIWDERFLQLAKHIATWSKDPSTKCGAVLTHGKRVVGLGYNGFPCGVGDDEWRLSHRELKYKYTVHAEVNAILMAGEKAVGTSLYVNLPFICNECAKVAIQAGIKEIVYYSPPKIDSNLMKRWNDSIEVTRNMCRETGIIYRGVAIENL